MTSGVLAWGAYLPRRRLARRAIAEALAWRSAPGARAGEGTRTAVNWDEDAITLAVEAARLALGPAPGGEVPSLALASTTLPFADRSNAGVVAEALGLEATLVTQDATGSQRAGTSALLAALRAAADGRPALVIASDRRRAEAGSAEEAAYGDGAAAVLVGGGPLAAEFVGGTSLAVDFVDHYREGTAATDYTLEERWIRTEGYLKLIPRAVAPLLDSLGIEPASITRFLVAAPPGLARAVALACGVPAGAVADPLVDRTGHTGCAHPLLLLGAALDGAAADDLILLIGFGQGVDVLLLRATGALAGSPCRGTVERALAGGCDETAYLRFLAHQGALTLDWGPRAERDARTAQSAHYRRHAALNGFVGGRCTACGTVQFPMARACVNPACGAFDTQQPAPLAGLGGHVKSFTEDWLAYSPDPPLCYGNVALAGGGNAFIEFTDVVPGELAIGAEVRFVFRIKDVDAVRRFHRYFWKATPVRH